MVSMPDESSNEESSEILVSPEPPTTLSTSRDRASESASCSIETLYNENIRTVENCVSLLVVLLARLEKIDLNNSALHQYCTDQACLVIKDLHTNMERQIRQSDREVAVQLAKCLQQITTCVSEVANFLEKGANSYVTDWRTFGDLHLQRAVEEAQSSSKYVHTDYIPKISDFKDHHKLALGNYGNVYKIKYTLTNTEMALKIVPLSKFGGNGDFHQSYVDKAVSAMVSDTTVIKMFCAFSVNPQSYIFLMDVSVTRIDLQRILDAITRMESYAVLLIIFQLVLAVEALHLCGFIHREVIPSNILTSSTGHIKLIDFDSAKVCRGYYNIRQNSLKFFSVTAGEFRDKEITGNLYYMAPEILKTTSYGRAADWWSIGANLYKFSTGSVPFKGKTEESTKNKILHQNYAWPPIEKQYHSATVSAKEFTHDLLVKQPALRLGSKHYNEIHKHRYMQRAAILFPDQKNNKKESVSQPLKLKIRQKGALLKMGAAFAYVEGLHDRKDKTVITYSQISDITEPSQHCKLLTYASVKFRKLFDRLRAEPGYKRSEFWLLPASPSLPQMDYDQVDTDAPYSLDIEDPYDQDIKERRYVNSSLLDALIPFSKVLLKLIRHCQVEVDITMADGGVKYPVISKLTTQRKDPRCVIEGDVLVTVNRRKVIGMGRDQFKEVLEQGMAMDLSASGYLHCQVQAQSIFREYFNSPEALAGRLQTLTVFTRTIVKADVKDYIRTRLITLPDLSGLQKAINYHIICYVHKSLQLKELASLLFGDILLSINNKPCCKMTTENVHSCLHQIPKQPLTVEVYEASSLHRRDLLEKKSDTSSAGATVKRTLTKSYRS